jgi:hypothetical protein
LGCSFPLGFSFLAYYGISCHIEWKVIEWL